MITYLSIGFEGSSQSSPSDFAFKVVDKDGNTHRIRSSADSLFLLKMAVGEKLNVLSSTLIIRYLDDEKDAVIISRYVTRLIMLDQQICQRCD